MDSAEFGRRRLVLVVDDNPDFLVAMGDLLTILGFDLVTARNGAEGLAMIHRVVPDVILLDLFMPLMDGVDFMRHIRAIGKPVPPVIAITGDLHLGHDGTAAAVKTMGAKATLLKPFTVELLQAAITHVLAPVAPLPSETDHTPSSTAL